jgi:hypothetical protein
MSAAVIVATVPVNAGTAATGERFVVVGARVVVDAGGGRVVDVVVFACGARVVVLDDARDTVLSLPALLHAPATTSSNAANAPARR